MPMRVYICPVVGTGTREDPFRSKAQTYYDTVSNVFPSKLDGTPASPWILSVITSSDFNAIAADSTCDDVFAGDLPQSVTNRDELLAFLRGRTLSQVPTGRRNAMQAVLDKYGIVRTDLTGTQTLWRLMRRIMSTLFELDDNFGSAF